MLLTNRQFIVSRREQSIFYIICDTRKQFKGGREILSRIYENFEINEVYKISLFLNFCLYDSESELIKKEILIKKKK